MTTDPHDTERALVWVQAQAEAGNYRVTQHAAVEMDDEDVLLDDVLEAVASGRIIENYPEHRRGACCLVYGTTENGRPLHVVCTTSGPQLILITVYEPLPPKWKTPTERMQSKTHQCSIQGCPGTYEQRKVVHTVRHKGEIVVIQDVPAEVCSVCGDVLFAPETVRHIQRIVRERTEPVVHRAPVYQYA